MHRLSLLLFTSSAWRPHAERIKNWAAATGSDPPARSLARSYISNLNVMESLGDLDDCCEFVHLLEKVGYPLNSKHIQPLQVRCSELIGNATDSAIASVLEEWQVYPESVDLISKLLLSNAVCSAAVKRAISQEGMRKQMRLAFSIWSRATDMGHVPVSAQPLNSIVSNCLCSSIHHEKNHDAIVDFLGLVAQKNAPLGDPSCEELATTVVNLCEVLSSRDVLSICSQFSSDNCGLPHLKVLLLALQRAFTRNCEEAIDAQVNFFSFLASWGLEPHSSLIENIVRQVDHMDSPQIIALSKGLRHFKICGVCNEGFLQLKTKLIDVLIPRLPEDDVDKQLTIFVCLSQITPGMIDEQFRRFLCDYRIGAVDVHRFLYFCVAMYLTGVTDVKIVSDIGELLDSRGIKVSREVYIYYLYVAASAKVSVNSSIVKKAYGKALRAGLMSRSLGENSTPVDTEAAVVLVCALSILHTSGELQNGDILAEDLLSNLSLSTQQKIWVLSSLEINGSEARALKRQLVTEIVSCLTDSCKASDIETLLRAVVSINYRDAVSFQRLLDCLRGANSTVKSVLTAAEAALTLSFLPQLERSGIVNVFDLCEEELNEKDYLLLFRSSSVAKRKELVSTLSSKGTSLFTAQCSELDTSDLLLLLVAHDSCVERQTEVLNELRRRNPVPPKKLHPEDAVLATEALSRGSSNTVEGLSIIFRVAADAFLQVNERQLMRLFQCVVIQEMCPNIIFRAMGRVLTRNAEKIAPDNTILWLSFYVRHAVRDDNVGRSLIKRSSSPSIPLSKDAERELRRAAKFFGVQISTRRKKKSLG